MPFYRGHGANLSPKPMSPTSPSSHRPQFNIPFNQTDAPRMYFEPKLLVNKLSDQLPPGVDPCQREVGAETAKSFYQFSREMLTPTSSFRKGTTGKVAGMS